MDSEAPCGANSHLKSFKCRVSLDHAPGSQDPLSNVHNLTPTAASQLHGDAGQIFISPLVSSSLTVLNVSVCLGPQFPPIFFLPSMGE